MNNKLYDKIKKLIKENYKFLLILISLLLIFSIQLPYYIEAPGGILDVSTRVEVENSNKIKGSFNLAYVSEFKATIPTIMYALISSDWDILKKEEILQNETVEQIDYRNHLLLEEANENAIIVAFNKANEYINITNRKVHVIYLKENAVTDLQVGDQILEVNNIIVESKEQLLNIINTHNGKFELKVINNDEIYTRYAYKNEIENVIGIVVVETKEVDTNLDVEFKFKKSESGPSGGFMMALSIYNYLIEEDITKGLKIVGTGTIDENGNVGKIGGIEYKIKAANKAKADLFFVSLDNYEEAKEVVEEENLKIKLIKVENIQEAIDYLNKL